MHFISHRQPAGNQRPQWNTPTALQRAAQSRAQRIANPGQSVPYRLVITPEPHHFAQALVDGAIGTVARCAVLDHQQGLAAGCQSGHRTYGRKVMVWMKLEAPFRRLNAGFIKIASPAFEYRHPSDSTAHRTAHPVPLDGWAGVQNRVLFQFRDEIVGRQHIDQYRVTL